MRFFLPWLGLVLCVAGANGQNPLAMATDPFSGSYQNEQLKLELTRKGAEYGGAITLGGQLLPVKAKAVAGVLSGTFESQGQAYSFEARRTGASLSLTTDGTTHVLQRAGAVAPVVSAAPATAPAVVGTWQSPTGVVRVNADGTAAIGDKTHRWSLEGNVITFSGNGQPIRLPFEMAGNTWTWKFPDGQLVLTRVGGTAAVNPAVVTGGLIGVWQGPSGNVQFSADGSATVGGLVYRYSQAGNQLTLAGADGTFVATLEIVGDTMTWLVNGKTLSFQRGAAVATGGAGGILPELVGKWCEATNLNNSTGVYSRSACVTLLANGTYEYASDFGATGQLPGGAYGTSSDSNDLGTWSATATTITSTSKKTGVRTFRLERRNNPKTGDAMIVLDGTEYTTAIRRPAWR
jgi:hypothetical protein